MAGWPVRAAARLGDQLRGRRGYEETLAWLVIWRFAIRGWARAAAAAAPPADVYHAHDLTGLPAAVAAQRRRGGRVVYDSHEIYLESGISARQPGWVRALLRRSEQGGIDRISALVTVNDAIGRELNERYRVPGPTVVVHNCPPLRDAPTLPDDRLRTAGGIPADAPLVIYHGSFSPQRGLEIVALALLEPGLAGVHAVYLGYGSQRPMLLALAAEDRFGGRLHVLDPVPPDEVVAWVSGADLEVMPLQPVTRNHVLSSPNKVFEALAAGVPVVASDFPVIRSILLDDPDGPLGAVCDPADPAAVAAAVRPILGLDPAARADLRARCLRAARERWNWETESAKLVDLYALLGAGGVPGAGGVSGAGGA